MARRLYRRARPRRPLRPGAANAGSFLTQFRVLLPDPQPVMQPEPAPSAASMSAGRALILVVEQDPQMQRLEGHFLQQAGFSVECAADGNEGLEAARRLLPDIVVAEILVAGLDGLSVCRALKSDPATRSIVGLTFSILPPQQRGP